MRKWLQFEQPEIVDAPEFMADILPDVAQNVVFWKIGDNCWYFHHEVKDSVLCAGGVVKLEIQDNDFTIIVPRGEVRHNLLIWCHDNLSHFNATQQKNKKNGISK